MTYSRASWYRRLPAQNVGRYARNSFVFVHFCYYIFTTSIIMIIFLWTKLILTFIPNNKWEKDVTNRNWKYEERRGESRVKECREVFERDTMISKSHNVEALEGIMWLDRPSVGKTRDKEMELSKEFECCTYVTEIQNTMDGQSILLAPSGA